MTATADTKTETPLVRLDDAGKNYGNIIALQGVTLDVGASEVTCVLGDNGAGKSTLIKIIAGLHQHTHGTYEVEGEPVKFGSPREALDRGIATVYQDLAVVPLMPVWRNFFLGNEMRKGPGHGHRRDARDGQAGAARHGHRPARRRPADRHPVGGRAPVRGHRPGRPLRGQGADPGRADGGPGRQAVRGRARYIIQAKERGLGVIFITHNPHHAYPVGDNFLILKRGRSLGYWAKDEITMAELTGLMAGGSELEELTHELEAAGTESSGLREVAHVFEQEVAELHIDDLHVGEQQTQTPAAGNTGTRPPESTQP
jgi:simple sugar transport system ATP-binding protein